MSKDIKPYQMILNDPERSQTNPQKTYTILKDAKRSQTIPNNKKDSKWSQKCLKDPNSLKNSYKVQKILNDP